MKYRLVIIFWIIFLVLSSLYVIDFNTYNNIVSDSVGLSYDVPEGEDVVFETNEIPYYNDMEYFIISIPDANSINVYGNDYFYNKLNLIPPTDNQYYGEAEEGNLEKLGDSPYIGFSENVELYSLGTYDKSYISSDIFLYGRSDNKEMVYSAQQKAKESGWNPVPIMLDIMPLSSYIFMLVMNLFFILLTIMFLFVDVNIKSKEMAISKILGYNTFEILLPKIKEQLVYSSVYFILLILPLIMVFFNTSSSYIHFLEYVTLLILSIYIISNLLYYFAFLYTLYKCNVVNVLKGKIDYRVINTIGYVINITSKILIVSILVTLIVPTYKILQSHNMYKAYIEGNENYVSYYPDAGDDPVGEFNYYNDTGAILSNIVNSSMGYVDSPEYLSDSEGVDGTYQVILVNNNYLEKIHFSNDLDEGKNYLFIPQTMKESTKEIEVMISDTYGLGNYDISYYNNKPIFTYAPMWFYETSGYIYYPIILDLNDVSETSQLGYVMNNFYYEKEEGTEGYQHINDEFSMYIKSVKKFFFLMITIFMIILILIMVSTYYMLSSHLQINGKEISIKRILGYSRFNIYRSFYTLDIICYIFGCLWIIIIGAKFLMPIWFIFSFIFIMFLLNEFNRKVMINKIERNKIVNIIKGEL